MAKVTTLYSAGAKTMPVRLFKMADAASAEGAAVLKLSIQRSIFRRAFRTGALFRSVETKIERIGRIRRIVAFTRLFYAGFIEYGTGRRGASTRPDHTPTGWKYGAKAGSAARQPFMLGLREALSEIRGVYDKHLRLFKAGAY